MEGIQLYLSISSDLTVQLKNSSAVNDIRGLDGKLAKWGLIQNRGLQ